MECFEFYEGFLYSDIYIIKQILPIRTQNIQSTAAPTATHPHSSAFLHHALWQSLQQPGTDWYQDNWQWAIDMDNEQWKINNEQWSIHNVQCTMDNEQQTMNDGQWTINDGQLTIDNRQWIMTNVQFSMNN